MSFNFQINSKVIIYLIDIKILEDKYMGSICTCSNSQNSDNKAKRKVNISMKERKASLDQNRPFRINLQPFMEKIRTSNKHADELADFQIVKQLGKGSQADVFEVKFNISEDGKRKTGICSQKTYALKRIYKNNFVNKRQSLELGKNIILKNDCPFIAKGLFSCQDQCYLYHIMDKAEGGDMATFLLQNSIRAKQFEQLGQEAIKFVAAGVVLGLHYLHQNGIIYSDLKLENVLIDSDGYPLLTDFQMSTKARFVKSSGYRGSTVYVAPQIFVDKQVDRAMDMWALGVLIYALAYGETPYSHAQIYNVSYLQHCQKRQNNYRLKQKKVSNQLNSLINGLLQFNPRKRLGYCTFSQIKGHTFFRGLDWHRYQNKQLYNPISRIIGRQTQNSRVTSYASTSCQSPSYSPKKRSRKQSASTQCSINLHLIQN